MTAQEAGRDTSGDWAGGGHASASQARRHAAQDEQTPGQAAYETWAAVMATNGVNCNPFAYLGNVEQMAWREVENGDAAVAALRETAGDNIRLREQITEVATSLEDAANAVRPRPGSGAAQAVAQRLRKILEDT